MQPDLPNFDPSSLVILDESVLDTQGKIHDIKAYEEVSGDPTELRLVFQTCLRLHRYNRATAILDRFALLYSENKPALLEVHNQYIQAVVSDIILNRKASLMPSLQKWFEVDMRIKGHKLEPDATTYALMIKASLHTLHGPKRDRTVRRYWDLAKKSGVEYEVLTMPILTEAEMGKITEVS